MSVEENKAVVRRTVGMFDALEPDALEDVLSSELAAEWREAMNHLPFSEHRIEITEHGRRGRLQGSGGRSTLNSTIFPPSSRARAFGEITTSDDLQRKPPESWTRPAGRPP